MAGVIFLEAHHISGYDHQRPTPRSILCPLNKVADAGSLRAAPMGRESRLLLRKVHLRDAYLTEVGREGGSSGTFRLVRHSVDFSCAAGSDW